MTAASASYFTDGAACTLIMSEDKAKALGLTPKAYLREYAFPSCDPFEELLLGPAYATTAVLKASGLKLSDMDVIEFHEAFAGQARPLRRTPALTLSTGPRAGTPPAHGSQPMSACGCSLCRGGLVSLLHGIEMGVRVCAGARQPGGARFRQVLRRLILRRHAEGRRTAHDHDRPPP